MDGVLVKGKKAIPKAKEALQLLDERNIAWILMTNGGGVSEAQRAEFLSEELDLDIDIDQIVQSHTPLVTLPNKSEQKVLVIGGDGDKSRKVAENYGFGLALTPADYIKTTPAIWPFHRKELLEFGRNIPGVDDLKIDSILVFNDPRDLEPRFGQGVIRFIIEQMYKEIHGKEIHGKEINRTILGKPTKVAYDYAHHILINRSIHLNQISDIPKSNLTLGEEIKGSHIKQVFMVGDNPASDIIGGYNYGWNTALVRTGVYRDGDQLPCKPTVIADDVYGAVYQGIKHLGLL
ncbi:unnamed protein product [Wickerhamomyces anomalus]